MPLNKFSEMVIDLYFCLHYSDLRLNIAIQEFYKLI